MALTLITAPTTEPVSLTEIKSHCRVDTALGYVDDTLLTSLGLSARLQAEHLTGRQMVTAVYELILPKFCGEIEIPRPPLQSVTSIKYYDGGNTQRTLSSSTYAVDISNEPGSVYPVFGYSWPVTYPRHDAVTIRFTCGYPLATTTPTTPESIRRWILIQVATQYEYREGAGDRSVSLTPRSYVDGLLDPYIIRRSFA